VTKISYKPIAVKGVYGVRGSGKFRGGCGTGFAFI
jgi:hypothetical protein